MHGPSSEGGGIGRDARAIAKVHLEIILVCNHLYIMH